jgi:hypothetical protein
MVNSGKERPIDFKIYRLSIYFQALWFIGEFGLWRDISLLTAPPPTTSGVELLSSLPAAFSFPLPFLSLTR